MSFIDCLKKKEKIAKLTPAQIKVLDAKRLAIQQAQIEAGQTADAAQRAASMVYIGESERVLQRNRRLIKSVNAVDCVWKNIDANVKAKSKEWETAFDGRPKLKKFVEGRYTGWLFYKPTINNEIENFLSRIDYHGRGLERTMQYDMLDAMKYFKPDKLGRVSAEQKKNMESIWRVAGGDLVDEAGLPFDKDIVKAGGQVREVIDRLTDMYIAEGGVMNKMENFMPQGHSPAALRAAGYDRWKADIKDDIDWDKTVDQFQLKIPVNKREKFLKDIFDNISSDGAIARKERGEAGKSQATGGTQITGKNKEHRVLHFKNTGEQIKYNTSYGMDNIAYAIMGHVQVMSRDIAILQNMGPMPDSMIGNWKLRMAGEELDPFNEKMYSVLLGRTSMTGNEDEIYKFLIGTQGIMRSAQLGSAVIPAIGDSVWTGVAAKMSGLEDDIISGMREWATGELKRGNKDELKLAAYVADAAMGNTLRNFLDDATFVTKGRTAGDKTMAFGQDASTFVMNASGLSRITEHGKSTITLMAMGKTDILKKKSWAEIKDTEYGKFMQSVSGINEADWINIQNSKKVAPIRGEEFGFLAPSDILDRGTRQKYSAYIESLRMLATNEPNLKTKTVTTQGFRAGTIERGMANTIFMYRGFPISLLNNYIRNILTRAVKRGSYYELAGVFTAAMISGYATMTLKDALKNKSPRDPLDPATLKSVALQSGALSIFDFVVQDQSRYGGSMAQTFMGPMASLGEDAYKVTGGLLMGWDEDNGGWLEENQKNASAMIRRYTPGASLWYLRAGGQASIMGHIDSIMSSDEDFDNRRRNQEQVMDKQGQDYIFK